MISAHSPLILGSASPRRREILSALGIPIRVLPSEAAEVYRAHETPAEYLERVVEDKLRAVLQRLASTHFSAALVADTIVVIDQQVLGKPADIAEAELLLSRLAGRIHQVFTRYAIATPEAAGAGLARTVESKVFLRTASPEELRAYAATGEGLDKAGAYAAQGIGAFLVERIEGSYTNVVGLPACEVVLDLKRLALLGAFPVGAPQL